LDYLKKKNFKKIHDCEFEGFLLGFNKALSRLFQGFFKAFSRLFQGFFKAFSRLFQGFFKALSSFIKALSKLFQWFCISKQFQGIFQTVSPSTGHQSYS
jgi:hypothetical protein